MVSVRDISRLCKIPESTVRRYLTLFDEFIVREKIGRTEYFPSETLTLIRRISQLYNEKKETPEIVSILRYEVPINITTDSASSSLVPESYLTKERFLELQDQIQQIDTLISELRGQSALTMRHEDEIAALQGSLATVRDQTSEILRLQDELVAFRSQTTTFWARLRFMLFGDKRYTKKREEGD